MPRAKKTSKQTSPRRVASGKLRAASAHVQRHYYAYMPEKKHHRVLIWVLFFVIFSVVSLQMLYPLDRAVPFARYGSEMVGWQRHEELSTRIESDFNNKTIQLKAGEKTLSPVPLAYAGAAPNTERMVAGLEEYPYWQRMIPLSILWQWPRVEVFDSAFTISKLREFAQKQSKELTYPAQNAGFTISNGIVKAAIDKPGAATTSKDVELTLLSAPMTVKDTQVIAVSNTLLGATKTAADFAAVRADTERAIASNVRIAINNTHEFVPTSADIASWLVIGADKNGKSKLEIDMARVEAYIKSISEKIGTPAGTTHVTITNGHETSRVEGTVGSQILPQPLGANIAEYVLSRKGSLPLRASLSEVAPTVMYNNKYTATQEGLQAYVNDMSARGAWIAIQQIDGNKWSASARADESIPSASTYKLFVTLRLFDGMDRGEVSWNDPILDTTVSGCFDRMTIASTNPCAVEWLRQFGRENTNNFVYRHGFSQGTAFTHPDAVHTTARDLTKFMVGVNDGSLINGAHRDRLFRSLSTHPYRYGIPTGSSAREVYDKVGFLWDYVHDTAIVRHTRGTYVMTIMTKGQSYAAIASMTREIERIMYP